MATKLRKTGTEMRKSPSCTGHEMCDSLTLDPKAAGVLTIYMENPEIPVGKSNGTHHSIWSTSEIMGFWSK